MPNSKYWCFTDFQVNEARHSFLQGLYPETVNQICYQEEVCPTTGRRHFQGFLGLTKKISRKKLQSLMDQPGLHCDPVKKSVAAAANYCRKSESSVPGGMRYDAGLDISQGERSDLQQVKYDLDRGSTLGQVYDAHFETSARYYRFFKEYLLHKQVPRSDAPQVYVLCGPTGTGKTKWVYDRFGCKGVYAKDPTNKWWDGYEQQHCLLIDEFHCNIPLNYMLRLLDRYPMIVETKGGATQFNSPVICITSNVDYVDWYSHCDPKSKDAFTRRVTEFVDPTV